MRPQRLEELCGQEHLTGTNGPLQKALQAGVLPNLILWGPPGSGKTTMAQILGNESGLSMRKISAISAGVAELRKVIEEARTSGKLILFIDEIHRFNKAQQDALLGVVESGEIVLIGATTENPGFEVNRALLSRAQTYILKELDEAALNQILRHAIATDPILKGLQFDILSTGALFHHAGGDARKMLNLLELLTGLAENNRVEISDEKVAAIILHKQLAFDKSGEMHYDIISAFIKSIRGSDPNAAVYWLARMLEGGEEIRFIARRMLILASEDIGNANPTALALATACFQAVEMTGMPEARIILSQCATYLASSPKSNRAYLAIGMAQDTVRKTGDLPVPIHLRNAANSLMKNIGYGDGYRYPHDYPGNFTPQDYLPDALRGTVFYDPGNNAREEEIRKFLRSRWSDRYGY
jgi:putative ATPase